MQLYGRRVTLAGISIPYILGFYLMGLSYYVNWTPLLFVGRIITGVLTGASAPTAQIYVRINTFLLFSVPLLSSGDKYFKVEHFLGI